MQQSLLLSQHPICLGLGLRYGGRGRVLSVMLVERILVLRRLLLLFMYHLDLALRHGVQFLPLTIVTNCSNLVREGYIVGRRSHQDARLA